MKYEWSEVFMSIEGEGPYSGHPTAYIRFARCNFTCGGFNNPTNIVDEKGYAPLTFSPADVSSIEDFSPMEVGCDTQYSVNPAFKHIWHKGSEYQLASDLVSKLPHQSWKHPDTGLTTMLSLTGGEPTLQWKKIPTLLNHPSFADLDTVLIETNCAVPFKDTFIRELAAWCNHPPGRKIIWSNSPKLTNSGESFEDAIRPEIAMLQRSLDNITLDGMEQYFKFVCGAEDKDFEEVAKVMQAYYDGGVPTDVPVYIMPESCTEDQQANIAEAVADRCIDKGYIYCHRVHNTVYANAIGK